MIECPICQVMNEDVALFCAECGQRFGPTVAKDVGVADVVEEPAAVPTSLSNKPARLKLHSPILGGSGGAEPEMDNYSSGYDKPQMSKLRGAPAPRNTYEEESHSNPSGHTPPKRGLRSPLLGGEDDNNVEYDDDDTPSDAKHGGGLRSPMLGSAGRGGAPKARLHSPLLGDDDFEEDDDDGPPAVNPGSGIKKKTTGGLRSPLLGDTSHRYDDDDDDDRPRGQKAQQSPKQGKQKLHSPLFGGGGGGNFDDQPEDSHRTGGRPQGKPKLHSPILGGGGGGDFDDEPEDSYRTGGRPHGKPKLHSPILGGGGGGSFDDEPEDSHRSGGRPMGKPKLHSPILGGGGGGDFDDGPEDSYRTGGRPQGKPKLHSPILGGGGGGADFDDRGDESHRAGGRPQGKQKLHSPMLGGDYDDEDYEVPRGARRPSSAGRKLHSPMLGGADEYSDDDDEDDVDEENQPVLRSPLLGAMSKQKRERSVLDRHGGADIHAPHQGVQIHKPEQAPAFSPPEGMQHPNQIEPPRNFVPQSFGDVPAVQHQPNPGPSPAGPPVRMQPPPDMAPPVPDMTPPVTPGMAPPLAPPAMAPPLAPPGIPPMAPGGGAPPFMQELAPPLPEGPPPAPPLLEGPPPGFAVPPSVGGLQVPRPQDFQPLDPQLAGQPPVPQVLQSPQAPNLDALGVHGVEFGVATPPSHEGLPFLQHSLHPPDYPGSPAKPDFALPEPPPERLLSSNRPLPPDTKVDRPFPGAPDMQPPGAPENLPVERFSNINKEQEKPPMEGPDLGGFNRTRPDVVDFVPPLPFEETQSLTGPKMMPAGLGQIEEEQVEEQASPERRGQKIDRRRKDRRMASPLLGGGAVSDSSYDDSSEDEDTNLPYRPNKSSAHQAPQAQGPLMILISGAMVGLISKAIFIKFANEAWAGTQMPWWFWMDQVVTPMALLVCLIMAVVGGRRR